MYFRVAIIITAMILSSCSSWVYRYDIPQGNYLDKKGIDQLQVGMNKEQVKFILGSPVVVDSFDDNTWSYVYKLISGRDDEFDINKRLILKFSNDKLITATGDYKLSDKFNTPFNADTSIADGELIEDMATAPTNPENIELVSDENAVTDETVVEVNAEIKDAEVDR